jgi:hypothetical protein
VAGEQGRAWVRESDAWMHKEGVRCPSKLAGVFAPGFAPADRDLTDH